jgi:hypothetical protein
VPGENHLVQTESKNNNALAVANNSHQPIVMASKAQHSYGLGFPVMMAGY